MAKRNLLKITLATTLAINLPVVTAAQTLVPECVVCTQLARFSETVPAEIVADVRTRIGKQQPALARLNGGQVCAAPALRGGLTMLNDLADAEFARAEHLAVRVGQCGENRTLKLASVEFCAATSAMTARQAMLERASTSFGIAASLYTAALARSQVVEKRLAADDPAAVVDVLNWRLNGRDLLELGGSLSDLVASGSADQGSAELAAVLVAAGQTLPKLGEDIDQALTRAAVMQPSTARALQKRALDLVADILWARESARQSGEARQGEIEAMPSIDANTVPISAVAGDYLQAVQCLEQASISAAVAAEGVTMGLDMIGEFSPKPACGPVADRLMSLADIVVAGQKPDKLNATLALGLCPAE